MSGNYQPQRTEVFYNEKVNPTDQLLVDRVFQQVRLSSFSLSGVRDSRDDLADPVQRSFPERQRTGRWAQDRIRGRADQDILLGAAVYARCPDRASSLRRGVPRPGFTSFPRLVQDTTAEGEPIFDGAGASILTTVRDLPASERFLLGVTPPSVGSRSISSAPPTRSARTVFRSVAVGS